MSSSDRDQLPQEELPLQPDREEGTPFVPSPVSRRIWAWMGVAYMVLAILLVTYWIATTTFVTGLTGLMLFPLLGALCAQGVNNAYRCRKGLIRGSFPLLLGTALVMGLIALAALWLGIWELAGALGGGL